MDILTPDEYQEALAALEQNWQIFLRPEVTIGMAYVAGEFAKRHELRGFDAVQLAAFMLHHDRL